MAREFQMIGYHQGKLESAELYDLLSSSCLVYVASDLEMKFWRG